MPQITAEELERLQDAEGKLKKRYKKQNEYLAAKYDRLNITVPAGKKVEIQAAAGDTGKSVNAFCADLIIAEVSRLAETKKPINETTEDDLPEFMKD